MRRAFATLLYVVFGLPLTLVALTLLSTRPWALDRDFYKRALTDDRLYAALRAPELARDAPKLIRLSDYSFNGPALVAAAQRNIPVAEIKALGVEAVDKGFDALESAEAGGRLELDLRPLKSALRARSASMAGAYAAALPSRPGLPAPGDLSFRPSSVTLQSETSRAGLALRAAADSIPDIASRNADPERPSGARGPRLFSQSLLDRSAATTTALSALLLAGLAVLGSASAASRLVRAGRYVLLPSLIVLGLGAVLAIPGGLFLERFIPVETRGFLAGQAGLKAYLAEVLGTAARGFFITGLVGASLGGLLISLRRVAEPKEI